MVDEVGIGVSITNSQDHEDVSLHHVVLDYLYRYIFISIANSTYIMFKQS